MKLKELFEMSPYHAKGELVPRHWNTSLLSFFFSEKSLARDFEMISYFTLDNEVDDVKEIGLVRRKNQPQSPVYGVYSSKNKFNEDGYKVLFLLEFRAKTTLRSFPKDIPRKKLLQVKKVFTKEEFRGLGLGPYVYQLLVKHGWWILSDTSQLDGGRGLWEKLARRSALSPHYQIRILDDERGYYKDKQTGKVISYDSSNIHEDDIWTTGLDLFGEHFLLLISPTI